jgi:endonuclease/exonuclease/phosphatase family metal-dependent hydrolase
MRIATWNLERPKPNGAVKNARQQSKIAEIQADLWILTETNSAISLEGCHSLASESLPSYHSAGESFATIWSRTPILNKISTFDPYFAVCAEIESPLGPMIVYGSIITYANDRGLSGASKRWEETRKSIDAHDLDWQNIRKEYPNHPMVVAGDFNQSLDGSGWYADAVSTTKLSEALKRSNLVCETKEDMRKTGKLQTRATVDHICLSRNIAMNSTVVGAWEGTSDVLGRMSDHNGVYVDLEMG